MLSTCLKFVIIMISVRCKWAWRWAIYNFCKKNFFNHEKQFFLSGKAFFFTTEIEISTFQDAGHNPNGAQETTNSKFGSNYELWCTE